MAGICFFAAPPVIDATRVRENGFPLALIFAGWWQTVRRVSGATCCRFWVPQRGADKGRHTIAMLIFILANQSTGLNFWRAGCKSLGGALSLAGQTTSAT